MRTFPITAFIAAVALTAACHSSKKSTTTPAAPATVVNSSPAPAPSPGPMRPGTYAPGNEELAAIQLQYKEVTLEQLKTGHSIYTQGACINCHKAKDIYRYDSEQWVAIMDDMAKRSALTAIEKDAVYKYVLAIKAVQPK